MWKQCHVAVLFKTKGEGRNIDARVPRKKDSILEAKEKGSEANILKWDVPTSSRMRKYILLLQLATLGYLLSYPKDTNMSPF